MKNICILTFEGNPIAAELYGILQDEFRVFMVYTKNINFSFSQLWKRKRGFRWFWYNHLFTLAEQFYQTQYFPKPTWHELMKQNQGAFIPVQDHNDSNKWKHKLQSCNIDLGVLIGTQLIKPDIYNFPKYGMINLHQGHIPFYRGMPPAYWEHNNGEDKMYVTVHTVVEFLDAGNILEEKSFSILGHKHFVISKHHANRLSVNLIKSSMDQLMKGSSGEKRAITKKPNTVPGIYLLLRETLSLSKQKIKCFLNGNNKIN